MAFIIRAEEVQLGSIASRMNIIYGVDPIDDGTMNHKQCRADLLVPYIDEFDDCVWSAPKSPLMAVLRVMVRFRALV